MGTMGIGMLESTLPTEMMTTMPWTTPFEQGNHKIRENPYTVIIYLVGIINVPF